MEQKKIFRLEKFLKLKLKEKYRKLPVESANGKVLAYSDNNLRKSIDQFIKLELEKLDAELFHIYKSKGKGYGRSNINRLFDLSDRTWNPQRDFVDLICFYALNESYVNSVSANHIKNNLEIFYLLPTKRELAGSKHLKNDLDSLGYYEGKLDLALKHTSTDLFFVTFNKRDVKLLQKLKPLKECLGEIKWHLINNRLLIYSNCIKGLKAINKFDELICGFFILYPITEECRHQIEQGIITESDNFKSNDICGKFENASAIYISIVYAMGNFFKASLLKELREELLNILNKYKNIQTIFSRPITEDGLRVINRHKFTQIKKSPKIYSQTSRYFLSRHIK